jgi:heat shock protein HspQ
VVTWVVALISKTERGEIMARVENGYDVEKYLKSNLDTVKWVSGGPHDDLFIFEVQAGLKNGKSGYDRISGVIRWIEGDSASNIWAKKREGENLDGVRKERITFKKVAESFNSVRNAKFKVGDRVRDTEARREGVIVEVDAEMPGYYAVKYDTRPQPQWNIPEEYLVRANSVRNAKFKVGDKVRSKTHKNLDVLRVRGVQKGETLYDLEATDGPKWARVKGRLPESDLVLANSVRNAKFKVGDKVKVKFPRFGYQNGIVTGIVDEPGIKKAYEIDFTNGERYTVAADAVFAANSVRSSNSVVAKALNAVAKFR